MSQHTVVNDFLSARLLHQLRGKDEGVGQAKAQRTPAGFHAGGRLSMPGGAAWCRGILRRHCLRRSCLSHFATQAVVRAVDVLHGDAVVIAKNSYACMLASG